MPKSNVKWFPFAKVVSHEHHMLAPKAKDYEDHVDSRRRWHKFYAMTKKKKIAHTHLFLCLSVCVCALHCIFAYLKTIETQWTGKKFAWFIFLLEYININNIYFNYHIYYSIVNFHIHFCSLACIHQVQCSLSWCV